MPPSSHWLIPLALFLLLGLAASLYIVKTRLPHESRAAGLRMLGTLPWSDFVQLALAVLNGRGYERSFGGAGTEGEYLLERSGQKWLLSSHHSRSWKPGSTGIAEFAARLRHQGLEGGILAIPGRFPPAAFTVAKAHRILLLDGPDMWDELESALSDQQKAEIERSARKRLRSQYALAWGGALVIAVLVGMAWKDRVSPRIAAPEGDVAASAAPTVEGVATGQAPTAQVLGGAQGPTDQVVGGAQAPTVDPAPATDVAAGAAPTTDNPATPAIPADSLIPLEERRTNIANAVADLPHVTSAHWPTPSTLQVQVDSEAFDPQAVCPLLESDPDLGASRLQVQYPAGSERSVRFLQCRAY